MFFSCTDIKAVTVALSALPAYDFASDLLPAFVIAESAGVKLLQHKQLNNREAGLVAFASDCACKALCNELTIEEEVKKELVPYLFTFNKLRPVFSPLLDNV